MRRFSFMATLCPPETETLTAHVIALPYRGDGVAWALRNSYLLRTDLPADMAALLAAIDAPFESLGGPNDRD